MQHRTDLWAGEEKARTCTESSPGPAAKEETRAASDTFAENPHTLITKNIYKKTLPTASKVSDIAAEEKQILIPEGNNKIHIAQKEAQTKFAKGIQGE